MTSNPLGIEEDRQYVEGLEQRIVDLAKAGEKLLAEIERLRDHSHWYKQTVECTAEIERLRNDRDRAYMRLQCADVPRWEPWHWEVCETMLKRTTDETDCSHDGWAKCWKCGAPIERPESKTEGEHR